MQTNGLHHVTAIASDPRDNVEFYGDVLGLRLVKRTVNFDDPGTYHLYYGDEVGSPGTALTFFPFEGGRQGRPGRGQATETALTVPEGSIEYWADRLDEYDVDRDDPTERFGESVLQFRDHDGQPLALVEAETDIEPWTDGPVPEEHAVRGFRGVTLHSADPESTGEVLEAMGYERDQENEDDDLLRYRADGRRAEVVDVLTRHSPRGREGAGTVHHVAFRAPDEETQLEWREELTNLGLRVTEQKDRQYFKSIYFREPGGILFEIATDGPGFDRDESVEELGEELKLPPWLEDDRERLESQLTDLSEAVAEVRR